MRRCVITCCIASLTTLLLLSGPAFAQILVEPAALNVATVQVGLSGSATFDVTNSGGAAVAVTDITSDDAQYAASPTAFSLEPAASQTVTVTFTPAVVGWEPAEITIAHDAGGPETVSLTGIGSIAPPTGDLLADTRIAMRADVGGNFDIYTADTSGEDRVRLTTDAAPEAFPTWRPDGRVLAFASSRSGLTQIYQVNADGTGLTAALTDPASNNDTPHWSPDGLRIAFESDRDGVKQLYLMDADGLNEVLLPTFPGITARAPSWSPDGAKIAFMAQPAGDWEVCVVNVDGSGLTNLTNSPGTPDESPVWYPDGAEIAFRRYNTIWHMNSDGSSAEELLNNGSNSTWSPDGTRIATQAAANQIRVWSADGSIEYPFTAATSDEQTPAWSPFLTPTPVAGVTPASLDFGSVDIATASTPQQFTITNTGGATLSVSAITSDNPAFVVSTTPAAPFDLLAEDPDLSQPVSVTFEPTAEGAQTANIAISHNASGGSTVVTATGTGTVPPVSVSIISPTVDQGLPPETTAFTLRLDVQGHASGAWAWQLDAPFADSGAVPAGANNVAGGNAGAMTGLVDGGSHTVYVALVDEAGALLDTAAIPNSRADVAFTVGILPADHVRVVSVQGGAGTVVTVPIEIYDITALAVTGVDIDLVYDDPADVSDDNVLTPATDAGALLDAASPGASVVPAGWVLEQNIVSSGRLAISLAGDPDSHLLGAGVLLNVTFHVSAGVDADTVPPVPLRIASLRVNEGVTPAAGVDGLFTILDIVYGDVTGDGTASALDASHVLGHVVAEGLAQDYVFPIEVTAPVWAPLPLTEEEAFEVADVDDDAVIMAMDAVDILKKRVGLIDVFVAEGGGTPAAPSPAVLAYGLSAATTSERPGARITVSLDTSAMEELAAGEFALDFDSSLLRLTSATLRTPEGAQPLQKQMESDGRFAIAFASARPIVSSDALLEVTFEASRAIAEPRESAIRATHLRLNRSLIDIGFVYPFRIEPYRNRLMANYPNPFNPETWIPFELAEDADVTIRIYDLAGSRVRTLELGALPTGEYVGRERAAYWDGQNTHGERVSSGVYVYELAAGEYRSLRRMVVMK